MTGKRQRRRNGNLLVFLVGIGTSNFGQPDPVVAYGVIQEVTPAKGSSKA